MVRQIRPDYDQMLLLPPSIDDWVPADHPARFIREFVDSLDLEELGFQVQPAETGRPGYSADLLLKVLLYGYFTRTRSSRKLEKACLESMPFIWLTGMNYPDHNTIWRFVKAHRGILRKLFCQSVKVAVEADLVGLVVHALDGTKIRSVASTRTGWNRKRLEKEFDKVERDIAKMLKEIEKEGADPDEGFRLPEKMKDKEERLRQIGKALEALKKEELNNLHPGEKDARVMKTGKTNEYAYNGQIVADGESGLIVAEDLNNEETDRKRLPPMMEQVKETLGESAAETVADNGYYSGSALAQAEEGGHEVTVDLHAESFSHKPYHSSKFRYDEKRDVCVCPQGKEMVFEHEKDNRTKAHRVRVFRGKSCKACPERSRCTRDPRGRSIEIPPWHSAEEKQRKKNLKPSGQALIRLRKQIAELPFAQIKWNDGFRRFLARGMIAARAEWDLVCTVYNLMKLYRRWSEGTLEFE